MDYKWAEGRGRVRTQHAKHNKLVPSLLKDCISGASLLASN